MSARFIHTVSVRLVDGHEALVTRVLRGDGEAFFGFSLRLDATEARHMAMHAAGLHARPPYQPVRDHPWETAFLKNESIPWQCEPGFAKIAWLPEENP